jgi:magnesium chelatase family protein
MNPCKCGHAGEPGHSCRRGQRCADDYQARLSGPLLDRFDLFIHVPPVSVADLVLPPAAEGSADVAARAGAARAMQQDRFEALGLAGVRCNAEADGAALEAIARPDPQGQALLGKAASAMKLTARGYHRVLRVARTLADLEGSGPVRRVHIAEALSYRREESLARSTSQAA